MRSSSRPILTGLGTVVAVLLTVLPMAQGEAAWSAAGTGSSAGAATVMPTGLAPRASVTGDLVSVTWPAVTLANGTAVQGYLIERINALTGSASAAGGTCSGTVTSTTCTDGPVPPGIWEYTDTPVQLSWTGGQSPPSNAVTVGIT